MRGVLRKRSCAVWLKQLAYMLQLACLVPMRSSSQASSSGKIARPVFWGL